MNTSINHQMIKTLMVIMFITVSLRITAQEEEYCCQRILMFPSFPMPKGQERDVSLGISIMWNSMILKTGAHELAECPMPLEIRSWEEAWN